MYSNWASACSAVISAIWLTHQLHQRFIHDVERHMLDAMPFFHSQQFQNTWSSRNIAESAGIMNTSSFFAFFVYKDIITTTTSVFWPLYRITCVSQHPWPRNGGFYRRKVSVPVCCCWQQLSIGMREKTLEFSSSVPVLPGNGNNCIVSAAHIIFVRWRQCAPPSNTWFI